MPYKDPEKAREMAKVYRARFLETEKGKAYRRAARERYAEKYPEHVRENGRRRTARWRAAHPPDTKAIYYKNVLASRARAMVRDALSKGRLTRESCQECGAEQTQAHHYRGYEHAAALDVIWLCRLHHAQLHRRMRVEDGGLPQTDTLP